MPSITPLLCDLFLSALIEVIHHTRTDIGRSALATVSFFWICRSCHLRPDDVQKVASLRMDHLRHGDAQDKVGAMEFFVHLTRARPEMLKDVIPPDVQSELITSLLEDWEVLGSMSE
jgi:hypothetical protein